MVLRVVHDASGVPLRRIDPDLLDRGTRRPGPRCTWRASSPIAAKWLSIWWPRWD